MLTIYHNPKCSKSRNALQYIKDKGVDFTVVEYLKNNFTEESLKNVLAKLNMKPFDIVRTQEQEYKDKYKGKNFTDDEWIKILLENPRLIKRPIVAKEHKAVLGIDVTEIDKVL